MQESKSPVERALAVHETLYLRTCRPGNGPGRIMATRMSTDTDFALLLSGGDRRSIGRSNQAARLVVEGGKKFDALFQCLHHPSLVIRMRAADALEKATRRNPKLLKGHTARVLERATALESEWEAGMNLVQMLGRLDLRGQMLSTVIGLLIRWLETEKKVFVKVMCLQSLADLAVRHNWLRKEVVQLVTEEMERGSAAIRARGRILLRQLETKSQGPLKRTVRKRKVQR